MVSNSLAPSATSRALTRMCFARVARLRGGAGDGGKGRRGEETEQGRQGSRGARPAGEAGNFPVGMKHQGPDRTGPVFVGRWW